MTDHIEKLKKAIGIDFEHSHGTKNQTTNPNTPLNYNFQKQQNQIQQPIQNQTNQFNQNQSNSINQSTSNKLQNNHINQNYEQKPNIPNINIQKEIQTPKENQTEQSLFVKIDKHEEIANEINEAKTSMKQMLDTIILLNQAEKLKKEAISKLEQKLSEFDNKLIQINNHLGFGYQNTQTNTIEHNEPNVAGKNIKELTELHSEIKNLKNELNNIKL
jgi:hypothetical protein